MPQLLKVGRKSLGPYVIRNFNRSSSDNMDLGKRKNKYSVMPRALSYRTDILFHLGNMQTPKKQVDRMTVILLLYPCS